MARPDKCEACGRPVRRVMLNGREVPLQMKPNGLGMLYITPADEAKVWTVFTGRSVTRYESHNYNCPKGGEVSDA